MNCTHAVGYSDIERLLIAPLLSRPLLLKIFSFHLLFLFVKLITNIIFLFDISKYFIIFLYKKVESYHHDSPPPVSTVFRTLLLIDILIFDKKKF
jgi:hypothetical protein